MSQASGFNTGTVPPSPPGPSGELTLVDDFIANASITGQLNWNPVPAFLAIAGTSTHPGLLQVTQTAGSGGANLSLNNSTANSLVIGGGTLSVNFVISLVTLSTLANPYIFWGGLSDQVTFGIPGSGIYFTYTDTVNAGKWVINCNNLGTITSVNTSVTAVTGFVNLGFTVNAAGTSVIFRINGAVVGTISTNLPTSVPLCPSVLWVDQPGYTLPNLPAALVDLFYLTYDLTSPR